MWTIDAGAQIEAEIAAVPSYGDFHVLGLADGAVKLTMQVGSLSRWQVRAP